MFHIVCSRNVMLTENLRNVCIYEQGKNERATNVRRRSASLSNRALFVRCSFAFAECRTVELSEKSMLHARIVDRGAFTPLLRRMAFWHAICIFNQTQRIDLVLLRNDRKPGDLMQIGDFHNAVYLSNACGYKPFHAMHMRHRDIVGT